MTIFLNKELKESLLRIDFSDLSEKPQYRDNDNMTEFTFNEKDLLNVKLDINSSISLIGMDGSQNNVNDLGKDLYAIYDELMSQTKKAF